MPEVLQSRRVSKRYSKTVDAAPQASSVDVIATSRLRLLVPPEGFLEASLQGDWRKAQTCLGLRIPREWGAEAELIEARLADFRADPAYSCWGLRVVGTMATRDMIGHVGFHSLPNPDYLQPYWPYGVELAYTIYPSHQRRGYGFEATRAMLQWAAATAYIRRFLISVAGTNTASRCLAEKLGFLRVCTYEDDDFNVEYLYVLQGDAMARLRRTEDTRMSTPRLSARSLAGTRSRSRPG
jgi:RimJ/RimL family protein N-acetyltransferase